MAKKPAQNAHFGSRAASRTNRPPPSGPPAHAAGCPCNSAKGNSEFLIVNGELRMIPRFSKSTFQSLSGLAPWAIVWLPRGPRPAGRQSGRPEIGCAGWRSGLILPRACSHGSQHKGEPGGADNPFQKKGKEAAWRESSRKGHAGPLTTTAQQSLEATAAEKRAAG